MSLRTNRGALSGRSELAQRGGEDGTERGANAAHPNDARFSRGIELPREVDEFSRMQGVVGEPLGDGKLHERLGETIRDFCGESGIAGVDVGEGAFQLAGGDQRSQAGVVGGTIGVADDGLEQPSAYALARGSL